MDEGWFYHSATGSTGPVSRAALSELARVGDVRPSTLVWHPGLGQEWVTASTAGLVQLSAPPPLPHATINGTYFVCLLIAPIALALGELTLRAYCMAPGDVGAIVIAVVVNTALSWLDEREIKRSGRDMAGVSFFWATLFVPIYVYKRSKLLGRRQIALVVIIGAYIIASALVGTFDEFADQTCLGLI